MLDEIYTIPEDVIISPVHHLPTDVRARLDYEPSDYAISRRNARLGTKILSEPAAVLVQTFEVPQTILQAILSYSSTVNADPSDIAEEAGKVIYDLITARLLVAIGSDDLKKRSALFTTGELLNGYHIKRCMQVLDESEVYEAESSTGLRVIVKIARPNVTSHTKHLFENEQHIINRLDGTFNPALIEAGTYEERPFLILEFIDGVSARAGLPTVSGVEPIEIIYNIVAAYAHLHGQGVIHGDVHPGNLLIREDGAACILDYGYSREKHFSRNERGGVPMYYEPELALAKISGEGACEATYLGEQYALAALLINLLSRREYMHFKMTKREVLDQIVNTPPLPLSSYYDVFPTVIEEVFEKSLGKKPIDRFPSLEHMANSLRQAINSSATLRSRRRELTLNPVLNTNSIVNEFVRQLLPEPNILSIVMRNPPNCGINLGATGIAYALYRFASNTGEARLLSASDVWCGHAQMLSGKDEAYCCPYMGLTNDVVSNTSFYHGAIGVYCTQALISSSMGDVTTHNSAIHSFVSHGGASAKRDVTFGSAGLLIAASLMAESIQSERWFNYQHLFDFGNSIADELIEYITKAKPGEAEIPFLGIAHGWAGMLYALLRWSQHSQKSILPIVIEKLDLFALLAVNTGQASRWRRHIAKEDFMPSWCNGDAGIVHLWTEAYYRSGDCLYLELAEQAGWATWQERENDHDVTLCCGAAGRAYGLLNLYKATNENHWLKRAEKIAYAGAKHMNFGYSLYKSGLGLALLLSDLSDPLHAALPAFESEKKPSISP